QVGGPSSDEDILYAVCGYITKGSRRVHLVLCFLIPKQISIHPVYREHSLLAVLVFILACADHDVKHPVTVQVGRHGRRLRSDNGKILFPGKLCFLGAAGGEEEGEEEV